VQRAAAHGLTASPGQLPYVQQIQAAFGRHDVSAVQARTGPQAKAATDAMGARAYAAGGEVVFGDTPDLHTAAHEAAHVVQQRGGVQLKGGVGQAGDAYERHADQVADAVVRGQSAEALLDRFAPAGPSSGAAAGGVQRQVQRLQVQQLQVQMDDPPDHQAGQAADQDARGREQAQDSEAARGQRSGYHWRSKQTISGVEVEWDIELGGEPALVLHKLTLKRGDYTVGLEEGERLTLDSDDIHLDATQDSVELRVNLVALIPALHRVLDTDHWHVRFFMGGTARRVSYENGHAEWRFDPRAEITVGAEVGDDDILSASGEASASCEDTSTPTGRSTECRVAAEGSVSVLGHEVWSGEREASGTSRETPPDNRTGNLAWWWALSGMAEVGSWGRMQGMSGFWDPGSAPDHYPEGPEGRRRLLVDINADARRAYAVARRVYQQWYGESLAETGSDAYVGWGSGGQANLLRLRADLPRGFRANASRYPSMQRVEEQIRRRDQPEDQSGDGEGQAR